MCVNKDFLCKILLKQVAFSESLLALKSIESHYVDEIQPSLGVVGL